MSLASTLVPDAYTSERFFELERERILARSWVPVGYLSDVERPRQALVARVAGRSIVIARDEAGELHPFQNMVVDAMLGIDRVPPGDDEPLVPMFPRKRAAPRAPA